MKSRIETINELIKERGFTSYLEIGLGNGANFNAVKIDLNYKIGVDPKMPNGINSGITKDQESDVFFEWYKKECDEDNSAKIDLIFIDGLHHSDQVERDIVNAWNCLNKGGMILIHDVKPPSLEATIVPRKQDQWTGDVFKAWHGFKEKYPKIKTGYIDEVYGLGVIEKSRHKVELGFVLDIKFDFYMKIEGWK
jgi:hypothetical protein